MDANRHEINLSEYSLDSNGDIHLKTYSVSSEGVLIREDVDKKRESLRIDYDPVSLYSLKFDNPKNEFDIKTNLVDKAKNVITNFLDNASRGQLRTILIDYERDYLEGQSLAA